MGRGANGRGTGGGGIVGIGAIGGTATGGSIGWIGCTGVVLTSGSTLSLSGIKSEASAGEVDVGFSSSTSMIPNHWRIKIKKHLKKFSKKERSF